MSVSNSRFPLITNFKLENWFYGGNFNYLTGKVIKSQEKQNIGEKSNILVGKSAKSQVKHFYGRKSIILDIFNKIRTNFLRTT